MPAICGRAVDIVWRFERSGAFSRCARPQFCRWGCTGQYRLRRGCPYRNAVDSREREPRLRDITATVETHSRGDADDGEITAAPAELLERPSGGGWQGRYLDGREQLVRAQGGGEKALEELLRRDRSGPACAARFY